MHQTKLFVFLPTDSSLETNDKYYEDLKPRRNLKRKCAVKRKKTVDLSPEMTPKKYPKYEKAFSKEVKYQEILKKIPIVKVERLSSEILKENNDCSKKTKTLRSLRKTRCSNIQMQNSPLTNTTPKKAKIEDKSIKSQSSAILKICKKSSLQKKTAKNRSSMDSDSDSDTSEPMNIDVFLKKSLKNSLGNSQENSLENSLESSYESSLKKALKNFDVEEYPSGVEKELSIRMANKIIVNDSNNDEDHDPNDFFENSDAATDDEEDKPKVKIQFPKQMTRKNNSIAPNKSSYCIYCYTSFPQVDLDEHEKSCLKETLHINSDSDSDSSDEKIDANESFENSLEDDSDSNENNPKVKPKRKSSRRMTRKINGSTPKKDVSADKCYNWYCKHCFRSFSQRVNMEKHEKSCVKGKPYFFLMKISPTNSNSHHDQTNLNEK